MASSLLALTALDEQLDNQAKAGTYLSRSLLGLAELLRSAGID